MADAAIYYNNSITEISGYSMYTELRIGSNGDPWGEAEIVSGSSPYDAQYGRIVWDGDLEDGFDSGQLEHVLTSTVEDEDPETAVVTSDGESGPLTFSTSVYGSVALVQLRALALVAGSASWSNVAIGFYRDNVLVDSYSSAAGLSVDKSSQTGPVESEALLSVSSQAQGIDKVVISGTFRMSYDSTVIVPGAADLAGQFFVYYS